MSIKEKVSSSGSSGSAPAGSRVESRVQPPSQPPVAPPLPLCHNNVACVPPGPSNLQIYLTTNQDFERFPLGLPTYRQPADQILADFEDLWEAAGGFP